MVAVEVYFRPSEDTRIFVELRNGHTVEELEAAIEEFRDTYRGITRVRRAVRKYALGRVHLIGPCVHVVRKES
jgi:hypothetical protein